jgi:hypothetical protein
MAPETRYYNAGGTIARELALPSGGLEIGIFNTTRRRWVASNESLGHISGIGGDGDWDRISWQEAAAILGRLILDAPAYLDDAWGELHDATAAGWLVGYPAFDEERSVWEQHAYDPTERARSGVRRREWTAVAPTQLEVIHELARCLRLIREGRVPG